MTRGAMDLSGLDLSGLDLSSLNLSGVGVAPKAEEDDDDTA
jgi:hypothetical protein